ncbi:BPSS1780 family membrane protein [Eikenella sp. Marseille-P7795]|uniref:BPSS1780 family membrane protein n=1 Tax=Eikenella sp. Marseille-P7795 TaxID=2866577 RepID=UPI001CE41704|nr:BPSS1780 family membrane protein [Eikenella sp. Marseille-P7795]
MDNPQFNRYAPPRISNEPDSTAHNDYLAEPQAVPAGNAKAWIGDAWRLFKLRPGKLIGAALLVGAINIGLSMLPYIGGLLQSAFAIFVVAGFSFIAQQLEEEGDFDFGQIFIGFQENTKALLTIGAIGAVVALISNLLLVALLVGQAGDVSSAANLDMDEAQIMSADLSVIALSLLLGIIYSAFTFLAPALIILENETPKRSILLSWQGFSRNIVGAALCGLMSMLLMIAGAIPLLLGLLVVMPTLMMVPYTVYRDLFFK